MITFNSIESDFEIQFEDVFRVWIKDVIILENKIPGDIQYIFCHDEYLLDINIRFLNHNYYTDVITFPSSSENNLVSGEIYISLDRVKENSINHKQKFARELSRVIIHSVLHLIGYNDATIEEKKLMMFKEDYYLSLQPQKIS